MRRWLLATVWIACAAVHHPFSIPSELPGTQPLQLSTGWREEQRQEILAYLDRRIRMTESARDALWKPAFQSAGGFARMAGEQRRELRSMLGIEAHGAPS